MCGVASGSVALPQEMAWLDLVLCRKVADGKVMSGRFSLQFADGTGAEGAFRVPYCSSLEH